MVIATVGACRTILHDYKSHKQAKYYASPAWFLYSLSPGDSHPAYTLFCFLSTDNFHLDKYNLEFYLLTKFLPSCHQHFGDLSGNVRANPKQLKRAFFSSFLSFCLGKALHYNAAQYNFL